MMQIIDPLKYSPAWSRRTGFPICRSSQGLAAAFLSITLLLSPVKLRAADVLYTDPAKTLRIEQRDDGLYVVPLKNESQGTKLSVGNLDSPDEFHVSPDGAWLYGLRHVGSGLRAGDLFELAGHGRVAPLENFDELAWKNAAKLGAVPRNFSADSEYAMAAFYAWSSDSRRLLIGVRGGDKKGSLREGFVYFNTQTKKFEFTDYLRKLAKSTQPGSPPHGLPCAEPVESLPAMEVLTARFTALDQRLNQVYKERLAKVAKDRVPNLREAQRDWLKQRDEGLKLYLSLMPAAEQEKRRLQYLSDVTAARIDDFSSPLNQDL